MYEVVGACSCSHICYQNMCIHHHHHHHHHHQSLNHEGRWGTTDDLASSFLHFSLFCTALWDLLNSKPVHSLMLSSHLFLCPCRTPGLSILWCCLPSSSSVCLVFFPLSLCLARWFWPDLMNGKHDHTNAVCIFLRSSGGLCVVHLNLVKGWQRCVWDWLKKLMVTLLWLSDVLWLCMRGSEGRWYFCSDVVMLHLQVVPMLPRLLCEQLCSLNPDEDRLSFSVIWKMTEDGQVSWLWWWWWWS